MKRFAGIAIMFSIALFVAMVGNAPSASAQSAPTPPTHDFGARYDGPGAVAIVWQAVPEATHYRIGYVNMVRDYPRAKSSHTGNWMQAFVFVDVEAQNLDMIFDGHVGYHLSGLERGVLHAFSVRTFNSANAGDPTCAGATDCPGDPTWPSNPRWRYMTVPDGWLHIGGQNATTGGIIHDEYVASNYVTVHRDYVSHALLTVICTRQSSLANENGLDVYIEWEGIYPLDFGDTIPVRIVWDANSVLVQQWSARTSEAVRYWHGARQHRTRTFLPRADVADFVERLAGANTVLLQTELDDGTDIVAVWNVKRFPGIPCEQ